METLHIPDSVARSVKKMGGLNKLKKILKKEDEITAISELFNAASDPIRVKILMLLNTSSLCVCLMKEVLKISDSKLSYHLSTLKSNNLISDKKERNFLIYNITPLGKKVFNIFRHTH
jgi:ArsR family transcriptional regulator